MKTINDMTWMRFYDSIEVNRCAAWNYVAIAKAGKMQGKPLDHFDDMIRKILIEDIELALNGDADGTERFVASLNSAKYWKSAMLETAKLVWEQNLHSLHTPPFVAAYGQQAFDDALEMFRVFSAANLYPELD